MNTWLKKQLRSHTPFILGISILTLLSVTVIQVSSSDADVRVTDHRVRSAIYQASICSLTASKVEVQKITEGTYLIPSVTSVDTSCLEAELAEEFFKRGLYFDMEIGVYRDIDDSLVYGNYLHTDSTPDNSPTVLTGDVNNIIFQLPSMTTSTSTNYATLLCALILFVMFYAFVKRSNSDQWKSPLSTIRKYFMVNKQPWNTIIQFGDYAFDTKSYLLKSKSSCSQLTYKEGKLLTLFLAHQNQILERERILKDVWQDDGFFVARSMDVFISKLRKYLAQDDSIEIKNVRGLGYVLKCNRH